MDEKRKITKAAGLMSAATLISRILGFIRDMIFARYFGATGLSDTFFAAFRIPNLLRELFAEGSMSAALIPVLTEYRQKHGEEEVNRLVKIAFTFIVIVVGAVCILGIVFSPEIVTALAPGFLSSPEKFSLTVLLTRIMMPFLLFISLAALVMGALNIKKVFFIPALAPAMLNITLIISILIFESRSSRPIIVAAIGMMVGGFVQFAFQLPTFFKNKYRLGFNMNFSHPGIKKMALLLIPATLALSVNQINIVVSNILASFLPSGSITYLFYSMRLIQFPIGMFGVAMGMAILPALSAHAAKGDFDELRSDFSFALRLLFFITIPSMAGLIFLREPIVNILFQRGKFDYAATAGTAQALLFYALGIWAIVGMRIVTAGFYSMQNTKTPVKVAVVAMLTNIIFSLILMKPMQHSGLALANSIAASVNFGILFFMLKKKLGRLDGRNIGISFIKVSVASAVTGLLSWFIIRSDIWMQSGITMEKAGLLAVAIAVFLAVYVLLMHFMGSEELKHLIKIYKERKGRA
ncbi:MAG: murein biosynthesis integral membrane protein MurJ [Thermodesulfovibrionia bacterium]|nr:murein biosynthesis integral membrane protein MurJ [Thermodesulfovibrionia bacterium]